MFNRLRSLLAAAIATALAATLPLVAPAQTRKPVPRPVGRSVAKPAPRPALKPAPKPAAPPPRAAPVPAPVRSVQAPAPAPVPAPAPAPRAAAGAGGPFGVGTHALNLGIGLGSRYGYGSGLLGGGSSSVSPALSLSYEQGILALGPGVLGVGVFAGYQGASYDLGGGDKWKYTDLMVTLRGAFHYPVTPEFDAYGGLGLGVRRLGSAWSGPAGSLFQGAGDVSSTDLTTGLFVGGRYFFTERLGAFAELGYDQTYLKAGLTARF